MFETLIDYVVFVFGLILIIPSVIFLISISRCPNKFNKNSLSCRACEYCTKCSKECDDK